MLSGAVKDRCREAVPTGLAGTGGVEDAGLPMGVGRNRKDRVGEIKS